MKKTKMISLLYSGMQRQNSNLQEGQKSELFHALVKMIRNNEVVVFVDETSGQTIVQTIH
jgi:hypothetical protein